MGGRRRRGMVISGIGVTLIVALAGWTGLSGFRWLSTGAPPARADLMVVLGGGSGERFATALDLWRAGFAPRILVTDAYGYPDRGLRRLREGGVPARALLAPLRPAASTFEDALAIRQVIEKYDFESILVVTSPYHCRRAALVIRRVLADLDVIVTVTPSVLLYMEGDSWWRTSQGWITVAPEFPKLVLDWAIVPVGGVFGGQTARN